VIDNEAILIVKQAGDGVTMESFLSDGRYDSPVNSVSKILKTNYKSELVEDLGRNTPDRVGWKFEISFKSFVLCIQGFYALSMLPKYV
jgi:hypothetical protein